MMSVRKVGFNTWQLFLVVLVTSCITDVKFEEPQPEGITNEDEIPAKLRGNYASEEDSSLLFVSDKLIIRTNDHHQVYSQMEFDSLTNKLPRKDTTLHDGQYRYEVRQIGESKWIVHTYFADTLLNLSSSQVLRKFKGYFFVSNKEGDGSWIVKRVTYNRKGLIIGSIKSKEELLDLRQITTNADDSTIVFRPSRKEFRKFMKNDGFKNEEKFFKLK